MSSVGFTKAVQASMLDHFLTDPAYTPPATMYIALLTTMPTDDTGTGLVECASANGYARVSTAAADWDAAVVGANNVPSSKTNGAVKTFPAATGSWGTVVGFALYSASTAGTLLCVGALATSQAIGNGNTPSFAAGTLIIQMGDPADTY